MSELWAPNPTLAVTTGMYARFGAVTPNSWSEDDTYAFLQARGWDVKSLGVPTADIAQALKNLSAIGLRTPNAWMVHATWTREPMTLAPHDGMFFYGPMEFAASGPPLPGQEQEPTPEPPPSITTVAFGLVASATLLAYLVYLSRQRRRVSRM